ncbi:MAG TPA: alpha-glucan family phosphorylase, partial [Spirochaetia bacterium]|nr:alpha-glucan family phosphorylase [Spirochaetia bacterium]
AALHAEWEIFFLEYLTAFEIAIRECRNRLQGRVKPKVIELKEVEFRGADSQRPRFRKFSVKASIPEKLAGLRDIAYNLWWCWNQDSQELFSLLDEVKYERMGSNPVALIETIASERLSELAENDNYLHLYRAVTTKFNRYLNEENCQISIPDDLFREHPIAYFSMEYGLHESLPIYSGGLGILSGDHVKTASDLNLHMTAIGLLYKNGYFKQGISKDGDQLVEYYVNDFFRMPLQELHLDEEKVVISIEYPGRKVNARVWLAQVGRSAMYLFDTDIPENSPADRSMTAKLYGGGKQLRIEQEILLGIGGIRLLEKLKVTPAVFHLNEGHSAFLIIERLINLVKSHGLDVETAKEVIKANTVFTTHTPVPAGNETFEMPLVENYLKEYVESSGLAWQEIVDLGHKNLTDQGPYEMTALALKNSSRRNGVSRLHGAISRKMWADIWSGFLPDEVPIFHITNGVHAPSWITSEMKTLIVKHCSLNLGADLLEKKNWEKIQSIPHDQLWQTHTALKLKLFNFLKERITRHWTREGEDPALLERFLGLLKPNALTIGFARRFATYKRATLLLHNRERLKKLVTNEEYPVQFIFAGKAHPNDKGAFGLIKEIVTLSKEPEFLGKIIFVEDYDMRLARRLISGVDVWLNNPRRPLEASGTSGQKAGMNGILNFSILDGWWDEGYDPNVGWAFGNRQEYKNPETQDIADCDSLFDTLENEIIPLYYSRNARGVPEKWTTMMKHSMQHTIADFNTHRMLHDYTDLMYVPAAQKHLSLIDNNFARAREAANWKKSVRARFSSIHINQIAIQGIDGDILNVGDEITFHLEIHKGMMTSAELTAEVLIFQEKEEELLNFTGSAEVAHENIITVPMSQTEETDASILYIGKFIARKSGKFNYGIRMLPFHPDLDDLKDLNLVFWG